jgi:putative membrane protein
MSTYHRVLLFIVMTAVALGCLHAPFPEHMFLQHIPTVVAIVLLVLAARREELSRPAFACIVAFLLLHVVGARYIYSYVPYDQWSSAVFGINVTEFFGFRRNHYDRVVHFAFGVLFVRPVWEILTRRFRVPQRFALYASIEFVLAFSLLYEFFEWGLTLVLSPEDAGAYNGEQGDIWDAHRDMLGAFIGALLAVTLCARIQSRSAPNRGIADAHRDAAQP